MYLIIISSIKNGIEKYTIKYTIENLVDTLVRYTNYFDDNYNTTELIEFLKNNNKNCMIYTEDMYYRIIESNEYDEFNIIENENECYSFIYQMIKE